MTSIGFVEELKVGHRYEVGSHVFEAEDIKAFAREFDPQPFHLDEAAAERSVFGGLCASGWQTAAVWMALAIRYRMRGLAERRARGEPIEEMGPSPGIRDLKWLRPVYAGDRITYTTEIAATRPLNSRPGWGLVTYFTTGTNQAGERVISFYSSAFVQRRP